MGMKMATTKEDCSTSNVTRTGVGDFVLFHDLSKTYLGHDCFTNNIEEAKLMTQEEAKTEALRWNKQRGMCGFVIFNVWVAKVINI